MATNSLRAAFEVLQVDGITDNKAEGIAVAQNGDRIFCAVNEGNITVFGCRPDVRDTTGENRYSSSRVDTIRANPKDKKPVQQLQAVESWRALLGIADGCIQAFDPHLYRLMAVLSEPKGVGVYAVHEPSHLLCVVTKRKVSVRELKTRWDGVRE